MDYLLTPAQFASGFVNRHSFVEYFQIKDSVLGEMVLRQWVIAS